MTNDECRDTRYEIRNTRYEIRNVERLNPLIELSKEISEEFDFLYNLEAQNLTDYAVEVRYGEEVAKKAKEFIKMKLEVEDLSLRSVKHDRKRI